MAAVSDRIDLVEDIAAIADDWDALADAMDAGPFVRPGWFRAWASAFAPDAAPGALCVRRDGRLAGVLCVVSGRGAIKSPTNWHTPAYGPVACDADAARELGRAAVERAPSVLDVSFLDPDGPFAQAALDAAGAGRRRVIARPVLRSPYVDLEGDFESFQATLDSKFKREAKRRRRKLEEEGQVTLSFEDGRTDLDRLLDEGFAVEHSGWKAERGTAIAQSPETDRFYRDVAAWAAERGWLQLGFVRLDGRPIAFAYSLVLAGTVHVVKVGFDAELRRYAPGTILTGAAIERAYEQGQARYDFLGAEDRYKLDWTDDVRERIRMQAFGRTGRGMAEFAAWRYGRPAAKWAVAAVKERAGRSARAA
jgi:CelD/BcsL family acetyltransferase involved in cellulose biosynthesis